MKQYKTKPTKKQVENILKFYGVDINGLLPTVCDKKPKELKTKMCSIYGTSCKSRRKK